MSIGNQQVKISFILFLFFFLMLTLILTAAQNQDFKEKIKNARSFDDIFKREKTIILEEGKESHISRIDKMLISPGGDFIVMNINSDKSNVLLFRNSGTFIKALARKGSEPGEYVSPCSIDMNRNGILYVLDQGQRKIHLYDEGYSYKNSIPYAVNGAHLHLNSRNEMFLYLGLNLLKPYKCINKLDKEGKKGAEFDDFPKAAMSVNFNYFGNCIAIDKNDFIYTVNGVFQHIRKYDSDGNLIKEFGEKYVKMKIEISSGKSREFPRVIESFSIMEDVIMLVYDVIKWTFMIPKETN